MGYLKGNAVIGQSGGPTAVINQSLVGCLDGLRGVSQVPKILGARHAVRGIIQDDFIDLTSRPRDFLERLALTPAAALGSSRDKPDAAYCQKIFAALERHDVRYFFYIGGNDSSDTCRIVSEVAQSKGYDLRAFHVPKTIDNDLVLNDHTPGFGSAARFVACAFMGDNLDNKALPGIKINVVMGRHAGFLTAASYLARQRPGDGPHLIYVPEAAFDATRFISDVERTYQEHGRCLIAVSEGIHDAAGTPIATQLAQQVERDAHGNVQLSGTGALGDFLVRHVKEQLEPRLGKLRVRADTFGYVQRCFAGCVSPVDQQEAREAGRVAAQLAVQGAESGSITIRRTSNQPYAVSYERVALADVAAKTRTLPREYIVNGSDIAPSFRDYILPLVGELPTIEQF
ncbi:MAG: 6-phosphofructokinase [Planctomycetota bacterium]